MTTWRLPETLSLWESVATLYLAQNVAGELPAIQAGTLAHKNLINSSGVWLAPTSLETHSLSYEWIAAGADSPYIEDLAKSNGVILRTTLMPVNFVEKALGVKPALQSRGDLTLQWPQYPSKEDGGIVVCPYTFRRELELPVSTWQAVIHMLRTYGRPVRVLAGNGQRFDSAKFNEDEILSEASIMEKLMVLASAELIVGVPNEWLWLAAAWKAKKMIYFYPEETPSRRWFWQESSSYWRCLFDSTRITTPSILAGLRIIIGNM